MNPEPRTRFSTHTVIIGAGAAGLATAACLSRLRIPHVILDKEQAIGSSWLRRYERLHLHTHGMFSALPYLSFPRSFPRYPSRLQFAEYLASYVTAFNIRPRFGQRVSNAARENGQWRTQTQDAVYFSKNLVVATGYSNKPCEPAWPGQETFPGLIMHSSLYVNGAPFEGQDVLVVGFGNSAGEIALDLHEHGARVCMAVRSPVSIVPRDIFGVSTHVASVMLNRLPVEMADALSSGLRNLVVGDITKYGLEKAAVGPLTMIEKQNRVPLLDIGTLDLIKSGDIRIHRGIERFEGRRVTFEDGKTKEIDAVILATGYSTNLEAFLPAVNEVSDDRGQIPGGGRETSVPGLYFCGMHNAPAGLLREIGIEARCIARDIKKKSRKKPERSQLAMSGDESGSA